MQRFKKILVVAPASTDTTAVARRVQTLAASNGAEVVLFDVLPPLPRDAAAEKYSCTPDSRSNRCHRR